MFNKMDMTRSVLCLALAILPCSGEILTQFSTTMKSVDNQYIVRLRSSNDETIKPFTAKVSTSPYFHILKQTYVANDVVYLIECKLNLPVSQLKQHLEDEYGPFINYASNNFMFEAFHEAKATYDCSEQAGEPPCRAHASAYDAWGLSRISQTEKLSGTGKPEYKWSDSNDGNGVSIYVLDTGIYDEHGEFEDINVRWGFTSTRIADYEADGDLNGHGTHVAGIAAGKNYGVAKNAEIVAVKVLDGEGSGSAYDVLEGLAFVIEDFLRILDQTGERPKSVVNLSLGINIIFEIIDDAIRHGSEMGIIYVAAAGNDAGDACAVSPASSAHTITVAAVNDQDAMAYFSNYGSCVDILAPGENIKSAGIELPDATEIMAGTSMAAPFVAGVVARYLSHKENATNITCVREHLFNTAIDGLADIGQTSTPNRMLFAGCNTCFGDHTCEAVFSDDGDTFFTLPPLSDVTDSAMRMRCDLGLYVLLSAVLLWNSVPLE